MELAAALEEALELKAKEFQMPTTKRCPTNSANR